MTSPSVQPVPCRLWTDHDWSEPRPIGAGRHDTLGTYTEYVQTCARCGQVARGKVFARQGSVFAPRLEGQ